MLDYYPYLECFLLYFFSSFESSLFFLFFLNGSTYILYSGKIILISHVPKVKDIFNLQRSRGVFTFENLIIMDSPPVMTCFMQYGTLTVYHILILTVCFFFLA